MKCPVYSKKKIRYTQNERLKFYTTNKYYGGEYSVVLTPRCPFYQFFFIFVFPLQSFHVYYRESTITGNINLAILQDVQYLKEIDVICCHFTLKMVLSYNCFYYKIFQEYFFYQITQFKHCIQFKWIKCSNCVQLVLFYKTHREKTFQ